MSSEIPLDQQAESLRMYLLGRIHGEMVKAADQVFLPPTKVEKVDNTVIVTTRSGTKFSFEIIATVLDVGK